MKTITRGHVAVACGIVLAGLVYVGTRAKAGGPSNVPVFFTGSLLNSGQPLAGSHQVAFDLWDDSTATDAAFHVCTMPAAMVTVGSDGFFQIPLSTACEAAIPTHPSLWYQFTVDGTAFPRTAIGAVPFAAWAGAASNVLKPVTYTTNNGGTTSTSFVSALGSVCGTTAPTNGSFSDPASGTVGLQASKTLCQSACSSLTAHICLREDLDRFLKILGGTPVTSTGWVEDKLNECQQVPSICQGNAMGCGCSGSSGPVYTNASASGTCSCPTPGDCAAVGGSNGPPTNGPPTNGAAYGPAGTTSSTCDTVQPILCCD